ncbi:MAG: hypothetical protein IPO29_13550 [Anaerolineae bacterium]|nr:hypothetical protein [Anaerolineae bacterium]
MALLRRELAGALERRRSGHHLHLESDSGRLPARPILALYGGALGIRVGEPYPDAYTENIDSVTFGTAAMTTVFDFEPAGLSMTPPTKFMGVGQSFTQDLVLNGANNLYGYQYMVTYDPSKVSAVGSFVNTLFDTTVDASVPPAWNAVCAAGVCKFAASKTLPAGPVNGSGAIGRIVFTGPGAGCGECELQRRDPERPGWQPDHGRDAGRGHHDLRHGHHRRRGQAPGPGDAHPGWGGLPHRHVGDLWPEGRDLQRRDGRLLDRGSHGRWRHDLADYGRSLAVSVESDRAGHGSGGDARGEPDPGHPDPAGRRCEQ